MISSFSAHAEELSNHIQHMAVISSDSRQLLNYPLEIRAHALANMRGHLQALAEIMDAFANSKYVENVLLAMRSTGCNRHGKPMPCRL
jgi:hypothetical protein